MRILHTSDWHLGHTLHGLPRDYEHDRFLDWLVGTLVRERIDALLVCGDVFDTANPGARAQRTYYRFLARAREVTPHLQIVVIAGNHDSALRLQAPREILRTMQVHVVGEPRNPDGSLCLDQMVLPLHDRGGNVRAWCAAVPFLRPSDLRVSDLALSSPRVSDLAADGETPPGSGGDEARDEAGDEARDEAGDEARDEAGDEARDEALDGVRDEARDEARDKARDGVRDPIVDGVRALYSEVLDAARAKRAPGQSLLALGHCFMVGTQVSELSERKILGGNQHALPADLFGSDVDYVALGHLHRAQRIAGRENVRYCGSPIPLSMAEGRYRHQVCIVDLGATRTVAAPDSEAPVAVRTLPIPRAVDIVRVPPQGAAPIEDVLERIDTLPEAADFPDDATRPYLEARVRLDRPVPDVRAQLEAHLEDRAPRLVKITVEYAGEQCSLGDVTDRAALRDLAPEQVFRSLYASRHEGEVPAELLAAFHELLDEVSRGEEARGEVLRDEVSRGDVSRGDVSRGDVSRADEVTPGEGAASREEAAR